MQNSKIYRATCVRLILMSFFLFTCTHSYSQFSWAVKAGDNNGINYAQNIVIDHHHNEIICGYAGVASVFGSTTLVNYGGFLDAFIAKYDSTGTLLWAKAIGGSDRDYAYSVAVDAADNIYMAGSFGSSHIHFSPTDSVAISGPGGFITNSYLVKYDAGGNYLWAKTNSGANTTSGTAVTVDANGNPILGGIFATSTTFSGTTITGSYGNLFVAKYTSSGSLLWAKAGQAAGSCNMSAITTDAKGNIYPCGKISTSVTFGTTTTPNIGGDDSYFGKLDSSGNLVWMKVLGSAYPVTDGQHDLDCANGIGVDVFGNVYVAGNYLDTNYVIPSPLTIVNEQSAYVAKYTSAGAQIWMKKFGRTKTDGCNALALDAAGYPYITGNYTDASSVNIGGATLPSLTTTNESSFIAKLDTGGNGVSVFTCGSVTNGYAAGIAIDGLTGSIATTGYFQYLGKFGSSISLTSTGTTTNDIYTTRQINSVAPHSGAGVATISHTAFNFSVFPNPGSGIVTIRFENSTYHKLSILSVDGKIITGTDLNTDTYLLNTNNMAPGIYLISVQDEQNNSLTKRFVKE